MDGDLEILEVEMRVVYLLDVFVFTGEEDRDTVRKNKAHPFPT